MTVIVMIFLFDCHAMPIVHADELSEADSNIIALAEDNTIPLKDSIMDAGEPSSTIPTPAREEIRCLALNIYFEARGESEQGQRAVGHVVMNRVADKHYPDTVCDVVKQGGEKRRHRCQFSWWCDGRSDDPKNDIAWSRSLQIAEAIYSDQSLDPTDGALWYHAVYVTPYWRKALTLVKKIGRHHFYLKKPSPLYGMN